MRHPGFICVLEAHGGDYWVVDDMRVVGVHLSVPGRSPEDAVEAAMEQARGLSANGCFASWSIGTVPRCAAGNYLLGEPGDERASDPGLMCRRAGWFDDDDLDDGEVD